MPEDGIVCLDNGMYKIWFARNYRTHVANTLLLDNALATMGAGLPSAIMAAMLHPGRRVLAVCGDGGFMMNSQELETAVRLKLNLVVLILEDNAYGMIRWKQATDGFPDFGMTFGNPDFVAYARAYGAKGSRVETADGLAPALEAAVRRRRRASGLGPGRLFGEHAGPGRRAARRCVGARSLVSRPKKGARGEWANQTAMSGRSQKVPDERERPLRLLHHRRMTGALDDFHSCGSQATVPHDGRPEARSRRSSR